MYGLVISLRARAFISILVAAISVLFCPTGHALIISQIYGGGGNSGAPYSYDFIEIFNDTSSAVDIDGFSVQYAVAGKAFSGSTVLSGLLLPYQYYLIQEAAGKSTASSALPTPDMTGSLALNANKGKVALVGNDTLQDTRCGDTMILDLIEYGTSATCITAAPGGSNTQSIFRQTDALTNTLDNSGDNAADFIQHAPTPHNTSDFLFPVGYSQQSDTNTVSEPSTLWLLLAGGCAIVMRRRRHPPAYTRHGAENALV
jgi:uncharacterized protein